MRRRTLNLIPFLAVALMGSATMVFLTLRARQGAQADWRALEVQGLTLQVPAGATPPIARPGGAWTATEFSAAGLGRFRLARERPQGDLAKALQAWFELPGPLDRPLDCQVRGQAVRARPVPVFGPGAYVVRHEGRQLVAVCVFDAAGSRYWVQTRTAANTVAPLAAFHRVLLSMRLPDGTGVDPALKAPLDAAGAEASAGRHALDPLWGFALVGGVVLLAVGLSFGVSNWAGRAPNPPGGGKYLASGLDLVLLRRFRRQYFEGAVAVLEDRLVLYTFGTPLMSVPLADLRGRVTEGSAWFLPGYLELAPEGPMTFHKNRLMMRPWTQGTRLRIHTEDGLRLRSALGC